MSFARVGHPQHSKGKRGVRLKKAPGPKKEWVVSIDSYYCSEETSFKAFEVVICPLFVTEHCQWPVCVQADKRRAGEGVTPLPSDTGFSQITHDYITCFFIRITAMRFTSPATRLQLSGNWKRRPWSSVLDTLAAPVLWTRPASASSGRFVSF